MKATLTDEMTFNNGCEFVKSQRYAYNTHFYLVKNPKCHYITFITYALLLQIITSSSNLAPWPWLNLEFFVPRWYLATVFDDFLLLVSR